ncbi:hypothetical protein MRB53_018673 [Persea americana]|uniref:Uncharacterized protein n=1 Tax=Persea americana TaxID=3435 RepID=A0ACC2M8G2_PERAE|nr:hypothetical protein MRB53_018673 [Persea americana]
MEKKKKTTLPLHTFRVETTRAMINRAHIIIHSLLVLALLSYRASSTLVFFFFSPDSFTLALALAYVFVFVAELSLSFLWLLGSAFRWRPVSRTAFPDRISDDDDHLYLLPGIDVFICTADPAKEPAVDVMNTVLSAMSMDYPAEKLSVYLSDDAGAPTTLYALRKAFCFAKVWVPFCRRYGVRSICPKTYFCGEGSRPLESGAFFEEREKVKFMYKDFKEQVERAQEMGLHGDKNSNETTCNDHAAVIEVMCDKGPDTIDDHCKMPKLIYVSREKRPFHPHNFKAGALNVLLRVSSLISNAPYILVLDCDMYCNDPTSAKAAMCFYIDPLISPSLAFIQFPQVFHNISTNDIYNCQIRETFKIYWNGCDGLSGPILSGTCFYMKREALYGTTPGLRSSPDLLQIRQCFGTSTKLIKMLLQVQDYKCNVENEVSSDGLLQEAFFVASCTYEKDTKWGEQIGFLYASVLEDYITGFHMHCKGWKSIYYDPLRPQFLGSSPINLNDILVQWKRWSSGLLEVAFSRFCPLTYGIISRNPILHTLCYGYVAFLPLYSIFALCYATVPPLCLLNGISLYPKVSDTWFPVFPAIFVSSLCQHLFEVLCTGGSIRMWWNELRIWMVRSASSYIFGCLDFSVRLIGVRRVDFGLTNKVIDEDQVGRYAKGIFDFQGMTLILIPVVTCSILNMTSLIGGVWRVIARGNYDEMLIQHFLALFIVISSYPIFEAILIRKDAGRIPASLTLLSIICTLVLLSLGYIVSTM